MILFVWLLSFLIQICYASVNSTACGLKVLTLFAASAQLPGCRRGNEYRCNQQRVAAFDALNLEEICGLTEPPYGNTLLGNEDSSFEVPEVNATIFVDPVFGSDENGGLSRSSPVMSIQRALDIAASFYTKAIILLPGEHRLKNTLLLNATHSNLYLLGELDTNGKRPRVSNKVVIDQKPNSWKSLGNGIISMNLDDNLVATDEYAIVLWVITQYCSESFSLSENTFQ